MFAAVVCLTDAKIGEVNTEGADPIVVGSVGHWQKLSVIASEGVRLTEEEWVLH